MSYLRSGHVLEHVDGTSHDYVYRDGDDIVDYGGVTNEGLIEILCKYFHQDYKKDPLLEEYLVQRLSAKLKVKMRQKPLERKKAIEKTIEMFDEEKDLLLREFGLQDEEHK